MCVFTNAFLREDSETWNNLSHLQRRVWAQPGYDSRRANK
jgi:hypothetical protein